MESTKRVAIITGAAEGIGRRIALRLAKDGWDLPRAEARVQELAEILKKEYVTKVATVYEDVPKEEDMKGPRLRRNVGGLYVAGRSIFPVEKRSLTSVPGDSADDRECGKRDQSRPTRGDIRGSLRSAMLTVFSSSDRGPRQVFQHQRQGYLPRTSIQIIKQGLGWRILGAASVTSKTGIALHSVYCATTSAVRGLTQSAAMDYGKYGITVNAYAPGAVETPLLNELDDYYSKVNSHPRGTRINAFTNVLRRNGQPEDVAKLVSFFVSDVAAFNTRHSYLVNIGAYFD